MENNFQIASAAISDIGLNEKRPQNEDSYLDLGQKGVFAVADGVGGAQAGEVASQMAMEILTEAFVNFREGGDAEDLMKRAIEQANSSIFQMSHDLPQLSSMATTVVALHLDGNIATIGHVGDSRMYRLDGNGSLFRETQDHSIVEEEVRAGRMTTEQAATHPSRNVISRALGAERAVEVDMKTIMFEPQTAFLLCSDGITRHINDFEIRELLALDTGPADICDRMKRICYERGAEDNLTAVVVKVSSEPARQFPEQNAPVFLDLEEPTVATARPETNETGALGKDVSDSNEMETRSLEMPAVVPNNFETDDRNDEDFLMETESKPAPVEEPQPIPVSATTTATADNYTMFGSTGIDEGESKKSGGAVGRILSGIIMLLLGAIAGAVAYSFLMPKPTPEATPPKLEAPAIDFRVKELEDSRRLVDADPAKYIASTSVTPHDAKDYYLLGRAYLITGDYVKARAAFSEAKKRAQEIDPLNQKTLLNEIAMGMVIIDNTFTQKALADEISKNALTTSGSSSSNVNSNSSNVNR
jgi:serine/threonine protein phosphatase PrpC